MGTVFLQISRGDSCYALCIIDIARDVLRKKLDTISCLLKGIDNKFIYFNLNKYDDPENFYVQNPELFLNLLTRKKFKVSKVIASEYKSSKGDYLVEFWSIDGKTGHFTRPGKNTLQYSKNVAEGKIWSYRVFREVK